MKEMYINVGITMWGLSWDSSSADDIGMPDIYTFKARITCSSRTYVDL